MSKDPRDIIIKPVVSEKSYAGYDLGATRSSWRPTPTRSRSAKRSSNCSPRRVEKVHTINRKAKRSRNRNTGTYNSPASQKRAIRCSTWSSGSPVSSRPSARPEA